MNTSFTARIGVYFTGLFLLTIGTLMALWYLGLPLLGLVGASNQMQAEAIRHLEFTADYRHALVSGNIRERRGDILLIAESAMIAKPLEDENKIVQQEGKQVFDQLTRAYPDRYLRLMIVDPKDGRIRASSDDADLGLQFQDAALISRAGQAGMTELVEQIALPGGVPTLAIVRQIRALDADGYPGPKLVGILIALLDAQQLLGDNFLSELPISSRHETALFFDSAGRFIARAQGSGTDAIEFKLNPQVAESFEGTVLETNAKGQQLMVVYRQLPLSGTQSWRLVHYRSQDDALNVLRGRARILGFVGILLTLVSLASIILLARRLARPLKSLTMVAQQLGAGDLSVRASILPRESTELKALSKSFNAMADDVQQAHRVLETKVQERTAELARERDAAQRYLDIAGVTLMALNKQGRIALINKKGTQLLGHPENDLLGVDWIENFVPADQRYEVQAVFEQLMAGETDLRDYYENRIINAEGQERLVAWNNVLLRDERGMPAGILSSAEDITERKHAEEKLRRSEQNLAITLQSIGDAVIATDAAGRITRMNPTAERMTAWPLAEALGQPLTEVFRIINAQTRLPSLNPVQLVMARGEVVGMANHTALLARDGREYQIADSAAPIRNASDEIVGVVLVFSDVTEKYLAEKSLRETQLFSDKLLDSLPGIFYLYTYPEIELVRWNKQHETLLGYDTDEMKGRLATDWFSSEVKDAVAEAIEGVMKTGSNSIEAPMVAKDGHLVTLFLTGVRLELQGRSFFVGIGIDISERKQAEVALLKSEERWKFAIEGAGDGLWDWNLKTGKTFYSTRYKTMLGFADDEIGDSADEWTQRIHPEDAPGVMTTMQPYLDGKPGSATVEFRMLCKSGSWRWILGRGMVVERDANGKPLRMIGTNADISERKAHQNQLEHIAHFDSLTNLPNRVLLADRLQHAMAQEQRRSQQLAVVYLDLDGFKAINDHHGHETGDQVLIALAIRMKQALREGDTLARIGGDEFVAVLIDLEAPSASVPLLDRLLAAVALPVQVGELSLQVSASLGVTFYPQAQDIDADQLMRQADQAMYQAKLAGKNCYFLFDTAQDSNIRVQHESLQRIHLALQNREFVLHYQPKVNMHSGQVIGAEALIRWQHPEKGLLAPATFLPVIEDHPLAVDVGEWVIDHALTQIELWHSAGLNLPVSVNIGARQLQQSDFVVRLQAILAKHPQVNPASLELEVLETSALADMEQVSKVIEECAQIGVKFALDDFGTGYSSLTYLKRLRVSLLKIDQSFVRDMLEDPDDLAILRGVIGLAAAFKREVIAEGVETVAHGTALLQLGCELAQGYGIARPMPPEKLPAWAASWQPDAAWYALASPGAEQAMVSKIWP